VTAWTPEHVVTPEDAAELIGAAFPELRGAPVVPLAVGWDNTVHLVDDRWVFRFPRRAIAVPAVVRECAVLPPIAPRLPLPVPVPVFVGRPSVDYPWPYWGARLVPGRELAVASPSEADRAPVAAALGAFLRALHDPALAAELPDLPRDPMGRSNPAARVPMARDWLARLAARGVYRIGGHLDEFLTSAEAIGPSSAPPVLCHGDLHIRHLLVAGDPFRATGVIDWGDVCLADPSIDVSLAYGGFAGPARGAFFDAYGAVTPDQAVRARVLAVFLCAALAEYAATEDQPDLLREALAGIDRAIGP
jgi:aminoglycoside phosphotransferase (APT) family kinase protein